MGGPDLERVGAPSYLFFSRLGSTFCFYLVQSNFHFENLYIYVWVGLVVGMVVAIKGLQTYIVSYIYHRHIFYFLVFGKRKKRKTAIYDRSPIGASLK